MTSTATTPRPPSRTERLGHDPVIVQPGRNGRARARVRVQWLALATALVILAGTLVAWALSRAADRVTVVSMSRAVAAGDVIGVDDLTISEVAVDASVRGLVPAASLDRLAGQVATIDLAPGELVTTGMWARDTDLGPDERTIGAVLEAGRFPNGLAHGATAWAIDVRADTTPETGAISATTAPTLVRVLDAAVDDAGRLHVTLAAPATDAVRVATLAATASLALVGVPAVTP